MTGKYLRLALLYGVSWALSSAHPSAGFLVLIPVGLMISLPILARGLIEASVYGMISSLALGLIALVPAFLPIVLAYLIWMIIHRSKALFSNILLIAVGILMYSILLFIPSGLQTAVIPYVGATAGYLISFLAGSCIIMVVCRLFARLGYTEDRITVCVLGFPALLFLVYPTGKVINSPSQ